MYQYRGSQTLAAERERQEQLKAELAEERNRLKEAMRVRRENERLEAQILATQQRAAQLAKPPNRSSLPSPIHGRRMGLKRAAQEIAEHERRKKTAA